MSEILESLNLEDYHANRALGSSGLREFMKTPRHYWYRYIKSPEAYSPTTAQFVGAAVHALVLEGEGAFRDMFLVADGIPDKRTKDWKERSALSVQEGKKLLTQTEYDQIRFMADEVLQHNLATSILRGGQAELSHFAELETSYGKVKCKARPDYVIHGDIIADYKTTGLEISAGSFGRSFFNFKNHVQGVFHKRVVEAASGKKINDVLYIAQMQNPPYLVRVFAMEAEHLNTAELEIEFYLPRFAECVASDNWPGYPHEITSIVMPSYYGTSVEE